MGLPFSLPPAAISTITDPVSCGDNNDDSNINSNINKKADRLGGQQPLSPTSPQIPAKHDDASTPRQRPGPRPTATKKRPAADFALPPPPTRARKIIQMKPDSKGDSKHESKPQPQLQQPEQQSRANSRSSSNNNKPVSSSAPSAKKKQSAANSSTPPRKVARKTAHSLIERRRRSKMNEEFSTLEGMIPACKDQDMHKLAILQAGIEYMNYLEQCIVDLKAANKRKDSDSPTTSLRRQSSDLNSAQDHHSRCNTAQELFPQPPAHAGGVPATQPSPTLGGSNEAGRWPHHSCHPQSAACSSTTTSPILQPPEANFLPTPSFHPKPSVDMDHEASAALLMLNKVDSRKLDSEESRWRNSKEPERKLGISVKDLLSH